MVISPSSRLTPRSWRRSQRTMLKFTLLLLQSTWKLLPTTLRVLTSRLLLRTFTMRSLAHGLVSWTLNSCLIAAWRLSSLVTLRDVVSWVKLTNNLLKRLLVLSPLAWLLLSALVRLLRKETLAKLTRLTSLSSRLFVPFWKKLTGRTSSLLMNLFGLSVLVSLPHLNKLRKFTLPSESGSVRRFPRLLLMPPVSNMVVPSTLLTAPLLASAQISMVSLLVVLPSSQSSSRSSLLSVMSRNELVTFTLWFTY